MISPAGITKLDGIVRSLGKTSDVNAANFHQSVENEINKIFPQLKLEEFNIVKFILIQKWLKELQNADDDGKMAYIDIQTALQKQQQTIQLMTNVSKMTRDVSMGIIRKIG